MESKHVEHVYPEFQKMVAREAKERLLGQRGAVFWLYGLSGSGKSTLAYALEHKLYADKRLTCVLDGDNVRSGLNRDLGFNKAGRAENIRRVAEVAALLKDMGMIVIAAFIAPTQALREQARKIVGSDDFFDIYLKCSVECCAQRDVKGLYAKARAGAVKSFTGQGAPFEEPKVPDLLLDTERETLAVSLEFLYGFVADKLAIDFEA